MNKFICVFAILLAGCSFYDRSGSIEVLVPAIDTQIDSFITSAKNRTKSKAEIITISFNYIDSGFYKVYFNDMAPVNTTDFVGFKVYGKTTAYFFCHNIDCKFLKLKYVLPLEKIVLSKPDTNSFIDWYSDGLCFDGRIFFRQPIIIPVIEVDTLVSGGSVPN